MKNEQRKLQPQQNAVATNNYSGNSQMFPDKNKTIVRYSDQELEEFKQLITEKLEASKKNYNALKETIMMKDDNGTHDTSPTFKLMEDAGDLWGREEISEYAFRQLKYIEHLENALIRVKNKTYGICHITGKLISKDTLFGIDVYDRKKQTSVNCARFDLGKNKIHRGKYVISGAGDLVEDLVADVTVPFEACRLREVPDGHVGLRAVNSVDRPLVKATTLEFTL